MVFSKQEAPIAGTIILSSASTHPTPPMDSATSEIQKLTYVKVSTAVALVTPRIPQEIIDEILDNLVPDGCFTQWLRSCSLVSKSWVESCRRHLFHTVVLNGRGMAKWLKTFPIPEQSPAHHVRDLCLSLVEGYRTPEEFFRRTQWFTNVKKMTVWGRGGGDQPAWIPSFGRLPQSATTLTVNANTATLVQIRDVMVQLPNLNDLSLSGPLVVMDREKLRGIGTALRGKFGGRLQLLNIYADIVNMLLEIPTGLHFTNVYIRSVDECLLPAARLAEACGDNLVNLTYTVNDHGEPIPSWFLAHETFRSRLFPIQMATNLSPGLLTSRSRQTFGKSSFRSIGPPEVYYGSLKPFRQSNPLPHRAYPTSNSTSVACLHGTPPGTRGSGCSTNFNSSKMKSPGSNVNL